VVDLRARNRADGSQEQRRQKKQLEVFQASIPGGSVQVIRSQTTTSSWHGQSTTSSKLDSGMSFGWSHSMNNSSSQSKSIEKRTSDESSNQTNRSDDKSTSRLPEMHFDNLQLDSGMSFGWSHSMNNSSSQSKSIDKRTSDESSNQTNRSDDKSTSRLPDMHFDNLQLAIHPLDLSPQKTKASVGRSGSISGRRPPTRPRSIAGTGQGSDVNTKSTTIKDQQQQRWQSSSASSLISKTSSETKSVFSNRRDDILNPVSLFSITGNRGDVDLFPVRLEDEGSKKKLFRMKSCSSEDLRLSPDSNHEDADDKGGADEWRRDSLERRSLQLPPVQPRNLDKKQTNVMRSRVVESHNTTRHSFISSQPKDVEKQTVIDRLKGTGWKSIEDVLKKNFDNQLSNSRNGLDSLVDGMVSPSEERSENRSATKKKNTFITVESLNAVRGRLRRTDSFSELLPGVERSNENIAPIEQEDDGILTESSTTVNDLGKSDPKSVKSFVYGIETVLQGDRRTGSLETRGNSKIEGGNGLTSKTEEWYNRRKSYGFEPVRQQQQSIANRYSSNLNTKINLAESTDSGICRSSETVANTATPWYTPTVSNKYTTADNNESRRTSHTITIKNSFNYDNLLSDSKSSSRIELLSKGIGSKGKRTVVTVGNEDQDSWRTPAEKVDVDKKIEKEADKFETSNGSSMLSSANVNLSTLQEPVLKDEEKEIVPRGKVADALRSLREKSSLNNSFAAKRLSEPITISIPSPVEDSENAEVNDFLLKQTKDPLETDRYKFKKFLDSETKNVQTSYSKLIFGEGKIKTMSKSFDGQADNDTPSNRFNLRPVSKINQPEFKRHSIAVDETKYITNKNKDSYELSSSAINENSNFRLSSNSSTFVSPYASKLKPSDNGLNKGDSSGDNDSNDKKQKKVEFCKTEVHFAAEPGRFNIVETDGKPPSNMNFRRRRKTISESTPRNTSNLPEIRFGDLQYEKALLTNNCPPRISLVHHSSIPLIHQCINHPGIKDDSYNGKDKSSPSAEQKMMKMISSQHNQHLDLIKEMDKYNGTIPEVRREEIGNRNMDMDEREERLSRVSNDSILEALENLSKQIENDIIEIPKIKDVKKEVKLKNSSVFKVIEDTGETRMKRFLRRRTDSNLSQSQLSDDTLQADEEVKSYMSAVMIKPSSSQNRTKEPCTSQFAQGIISQPKNKLPGDIPKGQSTSKFYSDSTNEKSHSDSTKSVETLVSTRSGHPRITSISLRYNDNHETNGAVFETPSSANKKYSRSSICIEPCDSGSSTTDISSSWKWSKGSKQGVRASAQNVSLSNIYSNATRTIEPVSSREDITALPDDDSAAALGYSKTKPTRIVTEDYQRKQVTKSASDQCVLLSGGKPQFGKVTAVVPPTVAYSSSVVLNYQPSPTQVTDNITTQHRSYQATTSNNARRGSKSEGVEKSKVGFRTEKRGELSEKCECSTSGRRDSWLNIPKDVSTSQVEQTRQSREIKVEKQRKKSSTAVDVRKKKKTTDEGLVEDCSDDLMRRGRESPIYANSNVFAHDYTAPTSSDRAETESFILEELTKAADEILRAVNGYTDDDSSFRGSSDDEPGKRYGRERKFSSSKPLGTISETPTRVKSQVVETKVRSTAVKSRLCKTSSNSSVEGGGSSADSKPLMEKPSKRRNVRLLQRASSREMLMKSRGAASSSEDVQSGSEQAAPPPRVSRMKTSRHTSQHQKSTIASQSRTKER
ncbi:LOW QUALITY PROTEIN: uncharacterized protein LOC111051347, partial [Nilaparvata lugens]|uniref:LOW QUALITY PROTEIN: uncharacterized protein LOC111051347 n=1 Tax=Nilaparvata lugens TaxID=108931 RepID=UPI00193D03AF